MHVCTSLEYLSTSYSMNFLALNDDVKFIIANHLQSDRKIDKIFMNEPDDNLQKNLFGEVKEMTLDIEEVCIDLVNDNKKFKDEIDFFKKKIIIKYIWENISMKYVHIYMYLTHFNIYIYTLKTFKYIYIYIYI